VEKEGSLDIDTEKFVGWEKGIKVLVDSQVI
jgi:hypothetical protein